MHHLPGPAAIGRMNTDELRSAFLLQDLFREGELTLSAIDLDRVVVGGAVPTNGPLPLEPLAGMAAEHFTERREIGILNIGGAGRVAAGGEWHELGRRDGLYVGRGTRDVVLESASGSDPARFYLVSYPAHAAHPTTHIAAGAADAADLGDSATANRRRLAKYFRPGGVDTAQLVMGVTEMHEGSVWNTMPPHTHQRRTEVYLYFDLAPGAVVLHLMGEPRETRTLVVREGEAVLSPAWSVHAGCGTGRYAFCWAMGGENQDFSDMQHVALDALR